MDIMDNYRGAYSDCEIVAASVEEVRLIEIPEPPLGWQRLESDQPKKRILSSHHFWWNSRW